MPQLPPLARAHPLSVCVSLTHTTAPYRCPSQVVLCEPTQQARNDACAAEAKRGGMTVVPPDNHRDVIAGQGTLGLEMAEQIDNLDAVVVPTSGGGMLAGVAMALAPQGIKVFAVEPAGKRLAEALATGERVVNRR